MSSKKTSENFDLTLDKVTFMVGWNVPWAFCKPKVMRMNNINRNAMWRPFRLCQRFWFWSANNCCMILASKIGCFAEQINTLLHTRYGIRVSFWHVVQFAVFYSKRIFLFFFGTDEMSVAHSVCVGSKMFLWAFYQFWPSRILVSEGLSGILLSVLVPCLLEAAWCGAFQWSYGQVGHLACIEAATASRQMVSRRHDIARILRPPCFNFASIERCLLLATYVYINLWLSIDTGFMMYGFSYFVDTVMIRL